MGYIANPKLDDRLEILLGSHRYKLTKPVGVIQASALPPKQQFGDYGRNSNPDRSTYSVSDLTGGGGLFRYPHDENGNLLGLNRFWNSENMNTLWPHAATIADEPGLLYSEANGLPAGTWPVAMNALTGVLVFVMSNQQVFYDNSGTISALIDTLPGVPYDSINFNSRVFWFQGANGYSYQTAVGSAATDVAAPTAQTGVEWDGKLYVMDASLKLHRSTTGDASTWTPLAAIPIENITTGGTASYAKLRVYENSNGESIIWALTDRGPWLYDAENDRWVRSRFQFSKHNIGNTVRDGFGVPYRQSLITRTHDRSINKLTMNGGTLLVEDISPGPDGLQNVFLDVFGGFIASPVNLYSTICRYRSTATKDALMIYNDKGWHCFYTAASTQTTGPRPVAVVDNANSGYILYFCSVAADGTQAILYFPMSKIDNINPLIGTGAINAHTYNTADGLVELPYFDGAYEAQLKTAASVKVKLNGAGANQTVTVSYRVNGSTGAYTTLGSAVNSDTETTLRFGTNNVGLNFNSIQFKLAFATNSSASAPKLEYMEMDYFPDPEVRKGFQVEIKIEKDFDDQTADQQITNIWAEVSAGTFSTFAYRDDADNTQSYLVKALRPVGQEDTGHDFRSTYSLFLYEIVKNDGT